MRLLCATYVFLRLYFFCENINASPSPSPSPSPASDPATSCNNAEFQAYVTATSPTPGPIPLQPIYTNCSSFEGVLVDQTSSSDKARLNGDGCYMKGLSSSEDIPGSWKNAQFDKALVNGTVSGDIRGSVWNNLQTPPGESITFTGPADKATLNNSNFCSGFFCIAAGHKDHDKRLCHL